MRVFLAGHRGMVGAAIARLLSDRADVTLITRTHGELDLTNQAATTEFFAAERPDAVILAAAHVGGIKANNDSPADFIYRNLMIATNVIHAAHTSGVIRLLNLGSSCIYPRDAVQPMDEAALLTGPLELTNEPYAIAKIAAIKLCESYNRQHGTDFRSLMPTNLYGPGDNFDPLKSHVLPGLLQRFHHASKAGDDEVVVWGTGTPKREFLHVDDMAAASVFVLDLPQADWARATDPRRAFLNAGTGRDISIAELAKILAEVTGFTGKIVFDADKPDGTPRKLLDTSRLTDLGWSARIGLREGIAQTYAWYQSTIA